MICSGKQFHFSWRQTELTVSQRCRQRVPCGQSCDSEAVGKLQYPIPPTFLTHDAADRALCMSVFWPSSSQCIIIAFVDRMMVCSHQRNHRCLDWKFIKFCRPVATDDQWLAHRSIYLHTLAYILLCEQVQKTKYSMHTFNVRCTLRHKLYSNMQNPTCSAQQTQRARLFHISSLLKKNLQHARLKHHLWCLPKR